MVVLPLNLDDISIEDNYDDCLTPHSTTTRPTRTAKKKINSPALVLFTARCPPPARRPPPPWQQHPLPTKCLYAEDPWASASSEDESTAPRTADRPTAQPDLRSRKPASISRRRLQRRDLQSRNDSNSNSNSNSSRPHTRTPVSLVRDRQIQIRRRWYPDS